MTPLFTNIAEKNINSYVAVLASLSIDYHLTKKGNGWELWVPDADHEKALACIEQYIKEANTHSENTNEKQPPYEKTYGGFFAALILLVSHFLKGPGYQRMEIINYWSASAEQILNGELHRTVTALLLHSDDLHFAGNFMGLALFGTAVCNSLGSGLGLLMILLTGMLGNFFNALLYQEGHVAIGASTAVFGAVGILAMIRFYHEIKRRDRRSKPWLPIGAC